ncbi:glycosyltransferase [Sneathiella glossodoripedis]|uniref:glycosyltransferase n=1 Tax=Sneathiella glossodoripedis TaxID=418853 RepID=UPI001F31DFC8|nr:glycosyltransferase [Sneathiella glossodoripedis]
MTVGHELGFDRLIRAVDIWSQSQDVQVFGQLAELTPESYRPQNFDYVDYLGPTEYQKKFDQAELIISHAGMGTIITAQTTGKPLLIMPRRGQLKETRNDHQVATARKFCGKSGIFVADDETVFPNVIKVALEAVHTADRPSASEFAEPALLDALRHFIKENG